MSNRSEKDEAAARYLLGQVTEEERISIERNMFEGDDAFEHVAAVEDELIDDYLTGELSAGERDRFEKTYLATPERRDRVEFARALRQRLAHQPRSVVHRIPLRTGRDQRFFLTAAAVLLVATGAYFVAATLRARRDLRTLEAEKASFTRREQELARQIGEIRRRGEQLRQELARERAETERLARELASLRPAGTDVISFTLTAELLRGTGTLQTFRIPRNVTAVRLSAPIPDVPYASYRAVVRTPGGQNVWKGDASRVGAAAGFLTVTVPAGDLSSGDYILSITGVTAGGRLESAADYTFRVKKT